MEILERSPQKVVIKEKGYLGWPRALKTWLLFTLLPLSFLGVLYVDKFSCRRIEPQQVDCQIDSKHWLGIGDVQSTLYPLVQKITKEERTKKGNIYYDYYIHSQQGEFKISFNDSEHILFNQFLENLDKRYIEFEIFTPGEALLWAIGLGLFSFANFYFGLTTLTEAYKSKIYIFNNSTRRLLVQTEKYRKTVAQEYSFEEICSLCINELSNDDDDTIYSLSLKLTEDREIPLNFQSNQIKKIEEIAKSIVDLLKINVSIKPLGWSSQLARRAKQKSHPVYSSTVN